METRQNQCSRTRLFFSPIHRVQLKKRFVAAKHEDEDNFTFINSKRTRLCAAVMVTVW